MLLTKLKIATGVLMAVGLVGTGTGMPLVPSAAGQAARQPSEQAEKPARRGGDRQDARPEAGQSRERPAGDRSGPSILPPGIERLDLSEPQRDKLAKLQKEFEEQLEIAKRKHAEVIEQARQNQDRQKAEEADQALRKEVGRLHEQVQGQLRQVLTDVQLRRLAELQRAQAGGGRPGSELLRYLGQLNLSAEQREKVERLVKEFSEQQDVIQKKTQEAVEKAKEDQDRAKVQELIEAQQQAMAKLHEQVHAVVLEILTEEQRQRLAELVRQRAGAGAAGGIVQVLPPPLQERLGLTAEQREGIARLQKEMEGRLREILTEEQNRQVEQLRRGEAPAERSRPKH